MDEKESAKAVGHIPSGLFVVCSKEGSAFTGYLASWVQQVSFRPLVVAMAIRPDRPGYKSIVAGEFFSINIVGEHEMGYLKHFWSGYDPANPPFKEIEHEISPNGNMLFKKAKSTLECKMLSKQTPGDHEVVFAEVVASYTHSEEAKPKVHIRKSGLDY